jgi:hypothetical protein
MSSIQAPKRRGRPPKPKPEPLPEDPKYVVSKVKRVQSDAEKRRNEANRERFKNRWAALKAKEQPAKETPAESASDDDVAETSVAVAPRTPKAAKPKPRRQPAPPTDTETEIDEVHIVRKPRKPKKTIVYVSDDETSEEEEEPPVTTKKSRNYSKKATAPVLNAGLNGGYTPPPFSILS